MQTFDPGAVCTVSYYSTTIYKNYEQWITHPADIRLVSDPVVLGMDNVAHKQRVMVGKKIVKGVTCDVRIPTKQTLLYFQNVIWFDDTGLNVTSFTSIRKEQPSYACFHGTKVSCFIMYIYLILK